MPLPCFERPVQINRAAQQKEKTYNCGGVSELLLSDLKREFSRKQVVIVAGAGVSILATQGSPCASWVGLLESGAERCGELNHTLSTAWSTQLQQEIHSQKTERMLSAGQMICDELGGEQGGEYRRWLRDSVGSLKPTIEGKAILELLISLKAPIITTNYDSLFEDLSHSTPVSWTERPSVERLLRGDDFGIFHLHGHWANPPSVVLGAMSYKKLLADEYIQTTLRGLHKTFLFVGYGEGLRDPNLGGFLDWSSKILFQSEYRSFRLSLNRDQAHFQSQHPQNQRIFVLGYGSEHSDLVPYLKSLRNGIVADTSRPKAGQMVGVPHQNEFFKGRLETLSQMFDEFESKTANIQNLLGLGGIGKTSIAVEYCYRYQQSYSTLLWLRATSAADFTTELRRVLTKINSVDPSKMDASELQTAFRSWLEENDRWLLVFDNADDTSIISACIPSRLKGNVLMTSRVRASDRLRQRIREIRIDKLAPDAATAFLKERSGNDTESKVEHDALRELVTRLDGLPLALEQAAAYMKAKTAPFADYLADYLADPINILERDPLLLGDNVNSVRITWNLNFREVSRSRNAADVLNLTAFLGADEIPFELLTRGLGELGNSAGEHSTASPSRLAIHELLQPLATYSLIRKDSNNQTYSVHRLVQLVLRDGMSADEREVWARRAVDTVEFCFPEPEGHSFDERGCERLISHAIECGHLIGDWVLATDPSERLLRKAALFLALRGQFRIVENLCNQLLQVQQQKYGHDGEPVADTLVELARAYNKQRRYTEAEPSLRRSISIFERQDHPDPQKLAAARNNLAVVYSNQGSLSQAEEEYERVVSILEGVPETNVNRLLELAKVHTNLGSLYKKLGRNRDAGRSFARAAHFQSRLGHTIGKDRPYLSDASNVEQTRERSYDGSAYQAFELGLVYEAQGLYGKALDYFTFASEKSGSPESTNDSVSPAAFAARARVLEHLKDDVQAERFYRLALAHDVRSPVEESVETTNTRMALGRLLIRKNQLGEAIKLFEDSLSLFDAQLRSNTVEHAARLCELGSIYAAQGFMTEAEKTYEKAIHICQQAPEAEDRNVEQAAHQLAWLYMDQGKYSEAEPLLKQMCDDSTSRFGAGHQRTIEHFHDLAILYARFNSAELAEPLFKQVVNVSSKMGDSLQLGDALESLAALYLQQGRRSEAEPLLQRAMPILLAQRGCDERVRACCLNLISLCKTLGHFSEAERVLRSLLQACTERFQTNDLSTVDCKVELAELCLGRRDLLEAERLFQQAIEAYEGDKHESPRVSDALSGLAWILAKRGQEERAVQLYRRSVELRDRVCSTSDDKQRDNLLQLSRLCERTSKQEAEVYLSRLVDELLTIFGPRHRETYRRRFDLARLFYRLGRLQESLLLLNTILAAEQVEEAPDPSTFIEASELRATISLANNEDDSACTLFQQVIDLRDSRLNKDDSQTLLLVDLLAKLYEKRQQYRLAKPLYKRLKESSVNKDGLKSIEAAKRKHSYGWICMKLKDDVEATSELTEVVAILEYLRLADSSELADTLEDLAELYSRNSRLKEARQCFYRSRQVRAGQNA